MISKQERKLHKYFIDRYGEYDDEAEWFVNTKPFEWVVRIPSLNKKIKLYFEGDQVSEQILF